MNQDKDVMNLKKSSLPLTTTVVKALPATLAIEKKKIITCQDLLFSLLTSSVCGIIISPGTNLHHPRNTNDPNEIH